MKPQITIHSAQTGKTIEREMTDEEYQALLDAGWTPGDAPTPDPDSDPA